MVNPTAKFYSFYYEKMPYRDYRFVRVNEDGKITDSQNVSTFKVKKISMKIETRPEFHNSVKMNIIKSNSRDTFTFLLEKRLISGISSLKINGIPAYYKAKDREVFVKIPSNIKAGDAFDMEIEYGGKIEYLLNPGSLYYFVSGKYLNLPEEFPWYPLTDENEKYFSIEIENEDTLLCNLNNFKLIPKGDNVIEGKARRIIMSVGDYETEVIAGKMVTASRELLKKKQILEGFKEYYNFREKDKDADIVIIPHIYGYYHKYDGVSVFSQLF